MYNIAFINVVELELLFGLVLGVMHFHQYHLY